MIVFNNCMAFIQGDLLLSKTAADIHTAGTQNSSSRLLFRTLAVHRMALNKGAFDSSSLGNFEICPEMHATTKMAKKGT